MKKTLEAFYRHLEVRNYSPDTIYTHRRHLKLFVEFLTFHHITDLTKVSRLDIRKFQEWLFNRVNFKGKKSLPQSRNITLGKVKVLYGWLLAEERIPDDPTKGLHYAKVPHTLPMLPPTTVEARRLVHAADTESMLGVRDRVALEILYGSGLRASELRHVKVNDVNMEDLTLRVVQGKGGKDRVVPITGVCRDWIKRYLKQVRPRLMQGKREEGWLLVTQIQNRMGRALPWRIVKRTAKAAGIDKRLYPHALRAACLTHMLRNSKEVGQNILRPLMEMAGHSDLSVLHRYTATDITELKEIHAKTHPRELEPDF
jgi:integrase/recombinase XerD